MLNFALSAFSKFERAAGIATYRKNGFRSTCSSPQLTSSIFVGCGACTRLQVNGAPRARCWHARVRAKFTPGARAPPKVPGGARVSDARIGQRGRRLVQDAFLRWREVDAGAVAALQRALALQQVQVAIEPWKLRVGALGGVVAGSGFFEPSQQL